MSKYSVKLFYHLCIEKEIFANSETHAVELAERWAESLTSDEFVEMGCPQSEGNEIVEMETKHIIAITDDDKIYISDGSVYTDGDLKYDVFEPINKDEVKRRNDFNELKEYVREMWVSAVRDDQTECSLSDFAQNIIDEHIANTDEDDLDTTYPLQDYNGVIHKLGVHDDIREFYKQVLNTDVVTYEWVGFYTIPKNENILFKMEK